MTAAEPAAATAVRQPSSVHNIWLISREYGQLAGAGGVKDVVKQLACALARSGRQVRVVIPCYGFMNPGKLGFSRLTSFKVDLSYAQEERQEQVCIWQRREEVAIYLVDSPRFRTKGDIYTYTAAEARKNPSKQKGLGHSDYFAMNILQQKAALALMIRLNEHPDIIHCHDGHTALLPAMLREIEGYRHYFHRTGCVVTIHNAGMGYHQEVADLPFAKAVTGLPQVVVDNNLLAGAFDPLLTAAAYALLNTVSENYARELRETDDDKLTGWLGHTLAKRGFSLAGVTNGIDPAAYNLKNYQALGLAAGFVPGSTATKNKAGKAACRRALITALAVGRMTGLKQTGHLDWLPQLPLFTFVGRFTAQKGIDKLHEALKKLLLIQANFQILILGSGQKDEEDKLRLLARQPNNSGRICLLRGFAPITATRIFAAGDFFLIPSRYEPCGLTDFQAQLFGNLPIAHAVGGLVKVLDGKTGFTYDAHDSGALIAAMQRAIDVFATKNPALARMQKAAITLIRQKYTWDKVMGRYLELYHRSLPPPG